MKAELFHPQFPDQRRLQLGRSPFFQAIDDGEIRPCRELAHLGKEFKRGWIRNVVVKHKQLPATLRQCRQTLMAGSNGLDHCTL